MALGWANGSRPGPASPGPRGPREPLLPAAPPSTWEVRGRHHGTTVAEHVCAEERVPTGAPQQPALLTARPRDPALGSTGEGPGTGTPQPRDCSTHGTGAWGRPLSPRPRGTSSWSLTMPRLTDGQASGRGQQHSVDSPGAPPGAMSADTGSLCTRCPLQLGPWSPEPPSTPQVDTWTSVCPSLARRPQLGQGPPLGSHGSLGFTPSQQGSHLGPCLAADGRSQQADARSSCCVPSTRVVSSARACSRGLIQPHSAPWRPPGSLRLHVRPHLAHSTPQGTWPPPGRPLIHRPPHACLPPKIPPFRTMLCSPPPASPP